MLHMNQRVKGKRQVGNSFGTRTFETFEQTNRLCLAPSAISLPLSAFFLIFQIEEGR